MSRCSLMLLLPAILLVCIAPRAAVAGTSITLSGSKQTDRLWTSMEVSQSTLMMGFPADPFPQVGFMSPRLDFDISMEDYTTYTSLRGSAPIQCMSFKDNRVNADCKAAAILYTCTWRGWACTSQAVTLTIKFKSIVTKTSSADNKQVHSSRYTDFTEKPPATKSGSSYTTADKQDTYSTTSQCTIAATTLANGKRVFFMTVSKPTMVVTTTPGP